MVAGFQGFVDGMFNPVFGWMMNIPAILAILFMAGLLALISTLLQKWMTDQSKMRRLKDDTKKYQEQMKKLRDQPDKMMKIQQKMLPIQMDLMKESFKPLLVTIIPFLFIFFWMSNHFAFYPVVPNQPFVVSSTYEDGITGNATLTASEGVTIEGPTQSVSNGMAKWVIRGPAGEHQLNLTFAGATFTRKVLVTSDREYIQPQMPLSGTVKSFNVENEKLKPLGDGFHFWSWYPGWIFYYILLSIPLSLLFKKWFDVV